MTGLLNCVPGVMLACSLVAFSTAAYAQQENATNDERSTACDHVFTSGAGITYLSYCVSNHSNLMSFISPAGFEFIRQGSFIEGYAVCSSLGVHGWDDGSAQSAWGPSAVLSVGSGGVKLARTTADGLIRLETQFQRDTVEYEVTVSVKIISLGPKLSNVSYVRYADLDVTPSFANEFDNTLDSVWAQETGSRRGITMKAVKLDIPHIAMVVSPFTGNNTCANPIAMATPVVNTDGQARVVYSIGDLNAGSSKTVKFSYKRH